MTASHTSPFIHASAGRIVDRDDRPLRLRGVGLGNWLVPEGYMWGFGDSMSSPTQIEARILSLVGEDRAAQFWQRFRDAFITSDDVHLIADWGFDHVRLPMNGRDLITPDGEFLEEGFARVKDLVEWCRDAGLYVLLDLHAAPGGQTGTNIDDSVHNRPALFEHEHYRCMTIELWRELARRYRNDPMIMGYDLLNEPLPNAWADRYPDRLVTFYQRLTGAVRAVDPAHMLVYEGTRWATDFSVFDQVWDPNSVLQFHRYWCAPTPASIQPFLDARQRLGLPIFMGEGGENTAAWTYAAHRLYERYNTGWNLWTWKKLGTVTSPLSATPPDRWGLIADPSSLPDPDIAWDILEEFLEAIPASRCVRREGLVSAAFGRAPLDLPAWAGRQGGTRAEAPVAGAPSSTDVTCNGQDYSHREELSETIWHHPRGEDYGPEESAPISLSIGDELVFDFESRPGGWDTETSPRREHLEGKDQEGEREPGSLTVRWMPCLTTDQAIGPDESTTAGALVLHAEAGTAVTEVRVYSDHSQE